MTHYTLFYRRNESLENAILGKQWNWLPIILSYIFNLNIFIMTWKGVQLCVQYPAGQLSRDTHHIKVKPIPSKIRTYYNNRKSTKQNKLNNQNKMDIDFKLEKVVFELLDQIPTEDFKNGFEVLEPIIDDWIFKDAILAMIPNGKLRLRKYNFLETISAEDFRIVLTEYYLDLLNTEAFQRMM